jgi:hypothetical protein
MMIRMSSGLPLPPPGIPAKVFYLMVLRTQISAKSSF